MRSELSPALRTVFVIILMTLPLLLVILQRLDDVKEIRRRLKAGEKIFNFKGMTSQNVTSTDKCGEISCERCGAPNPRGQAFCGACGNKLGLKENA